MGRSNWYYEHPPSCTCADCVQRRRERKPKADKTYIWIGVSAVVVLLLAVLIVILQR